MNETEIAFDDQRPGRRRRDPADAFGRTARAPDGIAVHARAADDLEHLLRQSLAKPRP
jgi:hypothetical protein